MQKIRPDMNIGQNIQRLRKKAGLTQDQVIAKLQLRGVNISKSSYAKIETNRMNIRISELVILKEILRVPSFDCFFENLSPDEIPAEYQVLSSRYDQVAERNRS